MLHVEKRLLVKENMMLRKLLLAACTAICLFQTVAAEASEEIRVCSGQECTSETARKNTARSIAGVGGDGEYAIHFYSPQTLQLFSYIVNSWYEPELNRTMITVRSVSTSNNFRNAIIQAYNFEKNIFEFLDVNHPGDTVRVNTLGQVVYRGIPSAYFGLSWQEGSTQAQNFGTSSWGASISNAVINTLAGELGISSSQLVSMLNQAMASNSQTISTGAALTGGIVQVNGQVSNTVGINGLPAVVQVAFQDGYVQLAWNPERQAFDVQEVRDAEGEVLPVDKYGRLSSSLLPNTVYISDVNRGIWNIIAARFNLTQLASALNSGRTGTVTVRPVEE